MLLPCWAHVVSSFSKSVNCRATFCKTKWDTCWCIPFQLTIRGTRLSTHLERFAATANSIRGKHPLTWLSATLSPSDPDFCECPPPIHRSFSVGFLLYALIPDYGPQSAVDSFPIFWHYCRHRLLYYIPKVSSPLPTSLIWPPAAAVHTTLHWESHVDFFSLAFQGGTLR